MHGLAGSLGLSARTGKLSRRKKHTFANLHTHRLADSRTSGIHQLAGNMGMRARSSRGGKQNMANRLIHSQISKLTDSRAHGIHGLAGSLGLPARRGQLPRRKRHSKPLNTFANLRTHGLTEFTAALTAALMQGEQNKPVGEIKRFRLGFFFFALRLGAQGLEPF